MEQRVEELLQRMDNNAAKYKEQHHNTVKYFEAQIAGLKVQLGKFTLGIP